MVSTKYRKRAKSENPASEKPKPKPDSSRAYSKILDTQGSDELDRGDKGEEKPIPKETALPANAAWVAPIPAQLQPDTAVEKEVGAETLIDKIRIEDSRNVFEIRLTKKANRLTRLGFYFNDIEIKPHTYGGTNSGTSFFNLLKGTPKKG